MHLNDITWQGNGEEEIQKYKKGEEIQVEILTIDAERERISLGIKQIHGDPFISFVSSSGKGSVVDGVVEKIDDKGVQIKLTEGVIGIIRNTEVARSKPKEAKSKLTEGQEVQSKIISIDRKKQEDIVIDKGAGN